jgi:hypothetical protein
MKNSKKEKPITRPKEPITKPSKKKLTQLPTEMPTTPLKESLTSPSREKPTQIGDFKRKLLRIKISIKKSV